jgi:RloB-like protein
MKTARRRLVDRTVNVRDAAIFYVATEDTHAADQYFRALQDNGLVDRSRVQVVVRPTGKGQSAPRWLIDRLDELRTTLDTHLDQDEFWILPDIDHHRDKELSEVAARATQKGYRIAASNPCFEVWLLLHETDDLSDILTYEEHTQAAAACEAKLRTLLGTYSKRRIDASRVTAERVAAAEARARRMDTGERWPTTAGSHVHRLTERLPKPRRAGAVP